jgi:hypothetical protein
MDAESILDRVRTLRIEMHGLQELNTRYRERRHHTPAESVSQHLADYSANESGSTAALGFDGPGHGFGFFKDADSNIAPPPYCRCRTYLSGASGMARAVHSGQLLLT